MLKTLLRGALWLLLALMTLALAGFLYLRSATLPQTAGTLKAAGLAGAVDVTRDAYGIPHIRAQHDSDAAYALGFVHAQDRAWQLDFQRRIAQGRLSEVLGEAALGQDKFLRTFGFQRAAETALPALSPHSRRIISAYTAGVNAGLNTGKTAPEFLILGYTPEPWTDVDSVAWSKLMSFDLGGNYEQELENLRLCAAGRADLLNVVQPPYPQDAPTILSADESPVPLAGADATAPAVDCAQAAAHLPQLQHLQAVAGDLGFAPEPSKGSNDWVVGGARTATGLPMLADDPHLQLRSPMLWYLADVQGGDLHAMGATIPGLPAVVIGRNERIGWGVTNHNPDVQDLVILNADTPVTERREVIRVKGGEDVTLTVLDSEYGPVISEVVDGGPSASRLALRWPTLMPGDTTLDAFLDANYAQNWTEFTDAMRAYVAPSQSFVYADVDGNIGYIAPGRIPLRRGYDGTLPVQVGAGDWDGWMPFSDLPQTLNPADSMVVTANNRSVPPGYPSPMTNPRAWAEPYRAARITELLEEKQELTLDDMAAVQYDHLSGPWRELGPLLLATPREGLSSAALATLEELDRWDGVLGTTSRAAAAFEWWLMELKALGQGAAGTNLSTGGVVQLLRDGAAACDKLDPTESGCADELRSTLERAASNLGGQDGDYGEQHQALSKHGAFGDVPYLSALFNRTVAAPGGSDTVNVARPVGDRSDLGFTHAASYRHLLDFSDLDSSRFVGTLGQSGNPLSPHFADQQRLWAEGQHLPMSMDEADWNGAGAKRLRLLP